MHQQRRISAVINPDGSPRELKDAGVVELTGLLRASVIDGKVVDQLKAWPSDMRVIVRRDRTGQGIARRARGFGMRVLYHNRSRLPELVERECGATYAGFDDLLVQADHVILVLPYSAQVHHLVDAAALAKMKPTATLVNIARGGIVDEAALADALSNGRLAAAGLDVYEGEPAVRPELLALRNVVLTPHIASASLATRRAMVSLAVDNLIAALGEGPDAGRPPSPVNPDALATASTSNTIIAKRQGA